MKKEETNYPTIAVVGGDLVVREDITLRDLHLLYPDIIICHSLMYYELNEGYNLNGAEYIIPFYETDNERLVCGMRGFITFNIMGGHSEGEIFFRQIHRDDTSFSFPGLPFEKFPARYDPEKLNISWLGHDFNVFEFCKLYPEAKLYSKIESFTFAKASYGIVTVYLP